MPNPVKSLKSLRGLSKRQKMIVARVRRAGLTPKGYHRSKYAGRKTKSNMTVHDPFLDIKRHARVSKNVKYVERYPQARDTEKQSHARYVTRVRAGRKAHGRHKQSLLRSLLYP